MVTNHSDDEYGPTGLEELTGLEADQLFPTHLYFGVKGQPKFRIVRREKPNMKKMCCKYRCCHYRTEDCNVIVTIEYIDGHVHFLVQNCHTDHCTAKNGYGIHVMKRVVKGKGAFDYDISEAFRKRCQELALEQMFIPPQRLWEKVLNEFSDIYDDDPGIKMPDNEEVRSIPALVKIDRFNFWYFGKY